jgi:peptidoglycan/LPS O-acetylase OafA/YrhL
VSYITYIIQAPLWHSFAAAINGLSGHSLMTTKMAGWQFLLFLLILLGASFLVSSYIERPARAWILRVSNKPGRKVVLAPKSSARLGESAT